MSLLHWDIYEIRSTTSLQGMMLRGRLRKFANQQGLNFLVENDEDGQVVRFAMVVDADPGTMIEFVKTIVPGVEVERVREKIPNPVLSKLKVNLDERYEIGPK